MNKKDLLAALESFKYPGLERTLKELNLIDDVKVKDNKATIVLSAVSQESYLAIKAGIIDAFSTQFDALDIQQKMAPAQDKNYGDTKAP
ncbi:MAG: ATP-binding protein, partial [Thiovulaceae bacterium]|nr:ATP-binding protein [Sulfurimonadaceae bacterium]